MGMERILVVESDPRILELASLKLSNAGYLLTTATNSAEFLQKVANTAPDLIVLNPNLADGGGYQACARLAAGSELKNIPILLLIDEQFDEEKLKNSGIKTAARLLKPFNPRTLLGHVNAAIGKVKLIEKMNPHTQLPGRLHLEEELERIFRENGKFLLTFCDLKDFNAYNKQYGYEEGNKVIQFTARLIQDELNRDSCDTELFHLGGDKFAIFATESQPSEETWQRIADRFDREIPAFYQEEDRTRGCISIINRQGLVEQWPLMTLALAVVTNEYRVYQNWLEIEAVGTELLKFAKSMAGSRVVRDRRRS